MPLGAFRLNTLAKFISQEAPEPVVLQGVTIPSDEYLYGNLTTNTVSSSQYGFTISVWVKLPLNNFTYVWCGSNSSQFAGGRIGVSDTGDVDYYGYDGESNGWIAQITTTSQPVTANKWTHIAIATDNSTNSRQFYVNGVAQPQSVTRFNGTRNLGLDKATHVNIHGRRVPTREASPDEMSIAQVWYDDSFVNLSSNISKFYNNGPVDLGTDGTATGLPQPLSYHNGNTSEFYDNNGRSTGSSVLQYTLVESGGTFTDVQFPVAPSGWAAYTGAEDGPIDNFSDATYGVGGIDACLATPNSAIVVTSGTENVADNVRIYQYTWDSSFNLTRSYIGSIDVPHRRSSGNYKTFDANQKHFVIRSHQDASQDGFIIAGYCQEGGGGGSQVLTYAVLSTDAANDSVTLLNTGSGTYNAGFMGWHPIPTYAEDSTYIYAASTAGSGGGSNSTNYHGRVRFDKSTGEFDSSYDTGGNGGAGRQDDGNRHPILLTSNVDGSGVVDPIELTYQGVIQDAGTTGLEYRNLAFVDFPSNATLVDSIVEMPESSRNVSWHSHYKYDKPGFQLYSIYRSNPNAEFRLVKAKTNGSTAPSISFSSNAANVPYVFTGYSNNRQFISSLGDTQGLVFQLVDDGTNHLVKLSAMDIDYADMSLGEPVTNDIISETSNAGRDISIARIDDTSYFVTWCDTSDNVYSKVVTRPHEVSEEPTNRPVFLTAVAGAQLNTGAPAVGSANLVLPYPGGAGGPHVNADASNSLMEFGTGDFTVETWVKGNYDGVAYWAIDSRVSGDTAHWFLVMNSAATGWQWYNDNQLIVQSGQVQTMSDGWVHIAVSRENGTTRMFQNGVLVDTATDNTVYPQRNTIKIGANFDLSHHALYQIDETRISRTARYTSSFTPQTEPFVDDFDTLMLVHFDGDNGSTIIEDDISVTNPDWTPPERESRPILITNNGVNEDTNNEFTESPTGYYGNVFANANLFASDAFYALSAEGDFTLECYMNSVNNDFTLFELFNDDSSRIFTVRVTANSELQVQTNIDSTTTTVLTSNQPWTIFQGVQLTHVAITRDNGTLTIWFDGNNVGSTSFGEDFTNSALSIVGDRNGSNQIDGTFAEVRLSSIARYTSSFTKPFTTWTDDADTSLLITFDGDGVFEDDYQGPY